MGARRGAHRVFAVGFRGCGFTAGCPCRQSLRMGDALDAGPRSRELGCVVVGGSREGGVGDPRRAALRRACGRCFADRFSRRKCACVPVPRCAREPGRMDRNRSGRRRCTLGSDRYRCGCASRAARGTTQGGFLSRRGWEPRLVGVPDSGSPTLGRPVDRGFCDLLPPPRLRELYTRSPALFVSAEAGLVDGQQARRCGLRLRGIPDLLGARPQPLRDSAFGRGRHPVGDPECSASAGCADLQRSA